MSKKKFTLVEPDNDDLDFFSEKYINLGQVHEEIQKMETNIPDKRKIKDYEKWKTEVNFLIEIYNKLCEFKAFKKYE